MKLRSAFLAALFVVASPLTAAADSSRVSDPLRDVSGRGWDIASVRFAHRDGKLVHRLRLRGSWRPSRLERGGKAVMRFVFAPGASDTWRYAVQVLWDPRKERLVGVLLDRTKDEPFQQEVAVRKQADGVTVKFHKWALDRPRSYAVGAFTAIETRKSACKKGFADGACRDTAGYAGTFVHKL